ncbi:MAG: DUF3524 domain-containing protein [Parahaliea sp.]
MRILLLSAYDAGSHRYWQRALQSLFPDWNWSILALPARHFAWRVRGNALQWAWQERMVLEAPYDLLIATSMVDVATLRGLVPALAKLPTLLYFHENQFAYPESAGTHGQLEAKMVSLYSALAADTVVFNSIYNKNTYLEGLGALLRRLPDYAPLSVVDELEQRSSVLAVPVSVRINTLANQDLRHCIWSMDIPVGQRPLRLLWVGRFEYDKGAEGLERILQRLFARNLDFELALCGQTFRRRPEVFERITMQFGARIVHCGYLEESTDYYRLLAQADIVLSTALHEFQGIAVMEAVLAGCVPLLPQRLAYPEFFPPDYLYMSSPDNPEAEADNACERLCVMAVAIAAGKLTPPLLSTVTPQALHIGYRTLITELCRQHRDGLNG